MLISKAYSLQCRAANVKAAQISLERSGSARSEKVRVLYEEAVGLLRSSAMKNLSAVEEKIATAEEIINPFQAYILE